MKTYRALLTQTGTNNPQVSELENSVGLLVWTRTFDGAYKAVLAGAFSEVSKVGLSIGSIIAEDEGVPWKVFQWDSADSLVLTTYQGDRQADGMLYNTLVEILVYL